MSTTLENLLGVARALPLNERQELDAQLAKDVAATEAEIEANLAIVRQTRSTIKGLDR